MRIDGWTGLGRDYSDPRLPLICVHWTLGKIELGSEHEHEPGLGTILMNETKVRRL